MTEGEVELMWQQVAIQIGHNIRSTVNTPEMIGTDDETGYILMFFNVASHDGKSTLISSETDLKQLKKLLKTALRKLNRAVTIEPPTEQ